MKTYVFPYGGSTGPGDTWDSSIEFELTEEEAKRLEASARAEPRWHLDEDETISDICQKIEQFVFEENKQIMRKDGRLKEARETWKYLHDDADGETPSDDELVSEEMGTWHVCYPEELEYLERNER